jgi:CRP-like cAMP-binding protein
MLFDFNSALRSAIQTNQVFSGAGADHVKRIMANGTRQKFKEKEVFIRAGQKNESLYLIVEGQVEVRLDQATDEPGLSRLATIKLNTLKPGDCFGEYSLIDRQTVSASVQARSNGVLFRISRPDFEKIISADNVLAKLIYKNLLEMLIARLRKKDKELDNVLIMT